MLRASHDSAVTTVDSPVADQVDVSAAQEVKQSSSPPSAQGPSWGAIARSLRTWQRSFVVAVALTVGLKLGSELVGLVSAFGADFPEHLGAGAVNLVRVWNHFDTVHYLGIAQHGYPAAHEIPTRRGLGLPPNIAFAPMYPWTVAAVHAIARTSWLASSQIVSAAALVVALTGLHRLTELDFGRSSAEVALFFLVAFPTGFFLLASYPESLSLAALVWGFLALRRGWWLAAGVLLAAATMAKYFPIVMVVPALVEVWSARVERAGTRTSNRRLALRPLAVAGPSVAAIGAWMVVCQHLYHDPLAFVHVQAEWERKLAAPWTSFARNIRDIYELRIFNPFVGTPIEIFDLVSTVLVAVMAVYVFRRVRRSYGVLLGVAWCVFSFETVLVSETREVLFLFPFFVGLAVWRGRNVWKERILLVMSLPCAYFLIDRFVTGRFAG